MSVFFQVVVIFGAALVAALLFRAINVPGIIGFLLAGVVIGPSGLEIIAREDVAQFAEIGLVLLLFVIGLELSAEPLIKAGMRLVVATLLQVAVTLVATALVVHIAAGYSWGAGALIGVAVGLSSTAIALKQMDDRGETRSTMGLISTGILLLQDVLVIVIMLLLSLLGPSDITSLHGPVSVQRVLLGLAGLVAATLLARRFLPWLINAVLLVGGRELVSLLAVLGAALGAWLGSMAGWSPALGAAVAGFLLSQADQRHQMMAEMLPFRDVFNAVFFISLGMILNLQTVSVYLPYFLVVVAAVLIMKPVFTALSVVAAGWPVRIAVQVGIGLCTVSEFGYILVYDAFHRGLVPLELLDFFIACTVGTMIVGALVFPLSSPISLWVSERVYRGGKGVTPEERPAETFNDHIVLIGYGVTGSNLARMLQATHLPFCVVEMNQSLVQAARNANMPIVVGDATRMALLEIAGIDTARVLVIAINDLQATQRIVAQVSARRPELYILVRTAFVSQIETLQRLGARLVIPEDLETSIEVAAHVLRQYGVPDNIIEAQIASVRSGGYAILRGRPAERAAYRELIHILQRTTTQTFYLTENSTACGQTIAELNLRARTGCMIVAVVKNGEPTANPAPDFVLECNDVLVLVGAHRQLEEAKGILRSEPAATYGG